MARRARRPRPVPRPRPAVRALLPAPHRLPGLAAHVIRAQPRPTAPRDPLPANLIELAHNLNLN